MKTNKSTLIILTTITLLVVAGGAFFAGTKFEKTKNSSDFVDRRANFMNSDEFMPPNNAAFTGNVIERARDRQMVNGKIIAIDDESVTVEKADSGSQIIYLSDTTLIRKSTKGAISDLTVGQEVMAIGQSSDEDLITAESIEIRPSTNSSNEE